MGLVLTLRSLFSDPWAHVKAWRERRDQLVKHHQPTYDSYPDQDLPPELRLYIEGRDVRGRLLREYVQLEGYSLHQLNWKPGARRGGVPVRDWFAGQVVEALVRLSARLDYERERRKEP